MERRRRASVARHLPVLVGAAAILFAMAVQLSLYPVFHVQRRAIRHEMKDRILAGLPASALTKFRYTPEQLAAVDFVDGGRELRHHGVMYDIARVYHDGRGQVVIEAARDDKETKLMADLGRMVERRVEQDAGGRSARLALMGGWAVYCEPWPSMENGGRESRVLSFREPVDRPGIPGDAIDPGPPRRG